MKQILKIGDDCFSSVLKCDVRNGKVLCSPERSALLAGKVDHG